MLNAPPSEMVMEGARSQEPGVRSQELFQDSWFSLLFFKDEIIALFTKNS
jgi:hypothetical protein